MIQGSHRLDRIERRLVILTYMVGMNIILTLLVIDLLWQVAGTLPK
jgi:hypothetical protein